MTVTVKKRTIAEAAPSSLSVAGQQEVLRRMIAARVYSSRCFALQRQGRLGTMAPIDGAEALVVGSAAALDPSQDWVLPQYREFHGLLRFGEDVLDRFVRYLRGDPSGGHMPQGVRVWPPQISLAAQIPHARGAERSLLVGLRQHRQQLDDALVLTPVPELPCDLHPLG